MKLLRGAPSTLTALLVAVPLMLVGACSDDAGDPAPAAASSSDPADQMLAYVRCLRDNGLQVRDPNPGDPYSLNLPKDAPSSKVSEAMEACRRLAPAKIGNAQDPRAQDRQVALARCLRRHGLDVPDPQPGQPLRIQGRDRERNKEALAQCRRETSNPTGQPT